MPYNDGVPRYRSFSLTDFTTFDFCPFRFFVFHHLEKKYELSTSSPSLALGTLLDESIKLFHLAKAYGCSENYLENIVKAALGKIKEDVNRKGKNSFYGKHIEFLDENTLKKGSQIFKSYYLAKNKKINRSLGKVEFGKWIISDLDGDLQLWGSPDCLEIGDDGIPEIVDYKLGGEEGKNNLDMDLMPKIYILLCSKQLKSLGYDKARFVVRFWLDPKNNSCFEEFDLRKIKDLLEPIFLVKIKKILNTLEVSFCEKEFCPACKSKDRGEFLKELEKRGFIKLQSA